MQVQALGLLRNLLALSPHQARVVEAYGGAEALLALLLPHTDHKATAAEVSYVPLCVTGMVYGGLVQWPWIDYLSSPLCVP